MPQLLSIWCCSPTRVGIISHCTAKKGSSLAWWGRDLCCPLCQYFVSRNTSQKRHHNTAVCNRHVLSSLNTHLHTLSHHSFSMETLIHDLVCIAMVTRYSTNDELSGKYHSPGINSLCLCVSLCPNYERRCIQGICQPAHAPHTNDGLSSPPLVKH